MISMKNIIISIALLLTISIVGCNSISDQFIDFNNENIEYMGRIGKTDSTAELYWSGSSIKIEFEGTAVSAILKDEKGKNYFNVIIDNDSIAILHLDSVKRTYQLAAELPKGKHTVQLFKRTEWTSGQTDFFGFEIEGSKVFSIPSKKRTIEFYGNSITCGYGVEDYAGDSPDSIYTNNYNSYAAVTARHFDANYYCTARSGIGITVSWFPMIMKEMYYRLNPADENSHWDFSKAPPDIVVINLFQNDSWLVNRPNNEQFKNRFGTKKPTKEFIINSYRKFVQEIRIQYPASSIICMLGNMDITKEGSVWPTYVKGAVKQLNDKKIHTLFVPYKNTPGHPEVEEQKAMANSLIKYIEKNIKW
ncbi:MAG: SGNH/GDSL hydrolase family protein [Bacteroidota bacterium]